MPTQNVNEFALDMYGQLRQAPGNTFFSPFSVHTALAMTLAGARGETAAQMRDVLGAESSDDALHAESAVLIAQLNAGGGGAYEMAVANSLWAQEGAPLLPEFLNLIRRHYQGDLSLVDFHRDAETARVAINRWVEERTKRRIQNLIAQGALTSLTRLVLANAVYFKGKWMEPFEKELTREAPFHVTGKRSVTAPLMHQWTEIPHMRSQGFQAVDLPYQGHDLSMLILLPDQVEGLQALEERLSVKVLHDCVSELKSQLVALTLPKFKLTWGAMDLSVPLIAMGMGRAFDSSLADFSGMNGISQPDAEALYIGAVFHKAFVEVNEQGTEAAAATAVMMEAASMPPDPSKPLEFRVDHPFLFSIRDLRSGTSLFLGRVADPTAVAEN